jgi:hypothetical protein
MNREVGGWPSLEPSFSSSMHARMAGVLGHEATISHEGRAEKGWVGMGIG